MYSERIKKRAKGQRRDPSLIPGCTFNGLQNLVTQGYSYAVVGQEEIIGPYSLACTIYLIELTLPNGTVVPCYSRGGNYVVVQDTTRKAFTPSR